MKAAIVGIILLWSVCAYSIVGTSAANYNLTASKEIVKFAAVAFCGQECLKEWTCKTAGSLKLTDILYIDNTVTKAHGFVGYREQTNQIVVSFRGTSNWRNWFEDGNFEKTDFPDCLGCKIHTGFYSDYLSVHKQVIAHITAILGKHPQASIITTGHSLGAALAAVSGIELKLHFKTTKVEVHNFGQPRIGNIELSKFMGEKLDGIIRMVHNKDIVPHLPPDMLDYHHPPYEVFFNEDLSSYKVCSSSGEDKSCSDKFFPNYDPNDHDHYFVYISQTQC